MNKKSLSIISQPRIDDTFKKLELENEKKKIQKQQVMRDYQLLKGGINHSNHNQKSKVSDKDSLGDEHEDETAIIPDPPQKKRKVSQTKIMNYFKKK